jgi:hypothetical protein
LVLVLTLDDPVPLLEPFTEFELVPPWLPVSFPVLLVVDVLELLPLLGCSLVVPAPPWFLLQPTSAKAAQTMRINLFIAVVFFNLCLCSLRAVHSVSQYHSAQVSATQHGETLPDRR